MPIYRREGRTQLWCRGSVAGESYKCSTGVRTDTEDAHQKAEEFEHALRERLWRRRKLGDRGAVSVKEAADRWLKTVSAKVLADDTAKMRWFLESPDVANRPVSAITVELNEELQKALQAKGVADGTVDKYMATWRRFLRKCSLEWQMMPAPPKVPMLNTPTDEPRWLTPDEFTRLMSQLHDGLQPKALFAVNTGLRMRAMLSLKIRNVDLPNKRAWIEKRFMKAGKTHGFPLNEDALRALKLEEQFRADQDLEHLNRCQRLGLEPSAGDTEHVFTYRRKPLDDCNTLAYQEALKAAGITGADWHTLRHTFASWAVQAGVSLQELMKLGPWESYEMVLVYAHLAPDNLSEAASRVARFGNQTNKSKKIDKRASATK